MNKVHVSILLMLLCSVSVHAADRRRPKEGDSPSVLYSLLGFSDSTTVPSEGCEHEQLVEDSSDSEESRKEYYSRGPKDYLSPYWTSEDRRQLRELYSGLLPIIRIKQSMVNGIDFLKKSLTSDDNDEYCNDNMQHRHLFKDVSLECGMDLGVYVLASKIIKVDVAGMHRIFPDKRQANLALLSALVQCVYKGNKQTGHHDSYCDHPLTNSKKATIFFKAFAQDFASNFVVAHVKDKAVKYVVKPVAKKYGIKLPANKLLNTIADASSWIVLRRAGSIAKKCSLLLLGQKKESCRGCD